MDKIYYNGTFLTMDSNIEQAEAVLVSDGVIRGVGTREELCLAAPEAVLVDMRGKTVLPGFIDGHSHLTAVASNMQLADLNPPPAGDCDSVEKLVEILIKFMKKKKDAGMLKKDGWIMGMGYDNSVLENGRHPGKRDLDRVSTEYPVAAVHVSGHICAVNSKGLELLGYSGEQFAIPLGGMIEAEGILKENAFLAPEKQKIMASSLSSDMTEAIGKASDYYASFGITTAQDARAGEADYKNLLKAGEKGVLKNDVAVYMPEQTAEIWLPKQVPEKNSYVNGVRAAGCKMFLDGSPQGKTAWLSVPYYEVPVGEKKDYCGGPVLSDEAVTASLENCIKNHWQVNVHANGDAAIEQMIRCYEAAAERAGGENLRPVIIHCQTARRDQIERMGRDRVLASFFNDHVYYWGDYHYESVLGPERAEHISPLFWALEAGVSFTLHQDSPVVPPDILLSVHNAVNRKTRKGRVLGADQRITVKEALQAVTIWGAYQIFEEKKKGSITPGKIADFVVLSANPLTVPVEKIKEIRVLETIKGGETVYCTKNDCNL